MLVRLLSVFRKDPDIEHAVLILGHGNDFNNDLKEMGVHVYTLQTRSFIPTPLYLFRLRQIVKKLKPAAIHAWMYHANMAAYHAQAGCPIVFSVHNTLDALNHEKWATRVVLRYGARLSRHANAVVYCSEKGRIQHELIGYDASHSIFIPNGVDTHVFRPNPEAGKHVRDMLGLKKHSKLFGQVARFHHIKNQTGLIKAFAGLTARSSSAELILIGKGCDHNNKLLVDLVSDHGIGNRVHLLGGRNDVEKILPGLDFLVSPSLSEAFPVAIAEAMACGLTCIATDVGDTAVLLEDTGVVVPRNDNAALTHAMQEMETLPENRRIEMGMKARKLIQQKYSIDIVASMYHTLYLSLITPSFFPDNPFQ